MGSLPLVRPTTLRISKSMGYDNCFGLMKLLVLERVEAEKSIDYLREQRQKTNLVYLSEVLAS